MRINIILISAAFLLALSSCNTRNEKEIFRDAVSIPAQGNSWIAGSIARNDEMISDKGISGWTEPGTVINTYFKTDSSGPVRIALRVKVTGGKSKIEYSLGNRSGKTEISCTSFDTIDLGNFTIDKPGYAVLSLHGLTRTSETYGEISDILVAGEATRGKIWFVRDDFYWGRRGPSVHLRYEIPSDVKDIKWFYNEITIPEGNDVVGSYFMANGFADGYFGIQVNSEDERRILFSVWSPYKTDNPGEIPEDYRISLLRKGDDVHAGEFGSEGSGGQSYLRFMWKTGTTYSFLIKGEPSENNSTDYTAWFFAPETGKWKLIAAFRRPKGSRYLGSLYSFLENFLTESGGITREGYFSNQWIYSNDGTWTELTSAKFTADATARKGSRLDYAGGASGRSFFLRNCGFFSNNTPINSSFTRDPSGKIPVADSVLENLSLSAGSASYPW